jgi:type IV secretion system protein VirB7
MRAGRVSSYFLLLMQLMSLSSCSSAGPFITNITSAGDNKLEIEKCRIELNGLTSQISNQDCTTYTVKIR